MYKRRITDLILDYLSQFPAVCLFGPRQVGKTTLVRRHIAEFSDGPPPEYLDFENPLENTRKTFCHVK